MALMLVPPLHTRYLNQEAFKLDLKERACRVGIDFYATFFVRLQNQYRVVYHCCSCAQPVAGVVCVNGVEGSVSVRPPCVVNVCAPCEHVTATQPMGPLPILRELPPVGAVYSNRSKIFARVEIYCIQNGKPMWESGNKDEGCPLLHFACPNVATCKLGKLVAQRECEAHCIMISTPCPCKLANRSGSSIATNVAQVATGVSSGKRHKSSDFASAITNNSGGDGYYVCDGEAIPSDKSDAKGQEEDRKPAARDNASAVRVDGRNESDRESVFRIGDGDRANLGSGEAAATGGATMYARMQNSYDGQSVQINFLICRDSPENPSSAFVSNVTRGRSTGEDPESESREAGTGSDGSDTDEVVILEPPSGSCIFCGENPSLPWATIICSCNRNHRSTCCQGCLEQFVRTRPPGLPAFSYSNYDDKPIGAFVRMEPEQRHTCYKCRQRFDSFETHLGRTTNIDYPIGFGENRPYWNVDEYERARRAHVRKHGRGDGMDGPTFETVVEMQQENAATFGPPEEGPELDSEADGDSYLDAGANVEPDMESRGGHGSRGGTGPARESGRGSGRGRGRGRGRGNGRGGRR